MRTLFRTAFLAFWALVAGLAVFTTETVADELGWSATVRAFIRTGRMAMFDASYDSVITALFWLLTGAVAVSWAEYALRKWEGKKADKNWLHVVIEFKGDDLDITPREGVGSATMLDGTMMSNAYLSDPKISRHAHAIILVFKDDILEPCAYVASDRKIIWRELKSDARHMVIEIDRLSKDDVTFTIVLRPKKWHGGTKPDAAMKWHDATVLPHDSIMS